VQGVQDATVQLIGGYDVQQYSSADGHVAERVCGVGRDSRE
jgi:hypothetical protein